TSSSPSGTPPGRPSAWRPPSPTSSPAPERPHCGESEPALIYSRPVGLFDQLGDKLEAFVDETFLPDDVRDLLLRGEQALTAGHLDEAAQLFEAACARRPESWRTQHML